MSEVMQSGIYFPIISNPFAYDFLRDRRIFQKYLYIYLNFRKFMYNEIKVAFSDTPEIEGYQLIPNPDKRDK